MKHKKLIGILATSALLLGSVASFAACGGGKHTIERVDETPATCTEGGHGAYYRCTDDGCDKIFSDIEGKHEIKWDDVEKTDPLGHSMTHVDAKVADCTEDGANEHYHCGRCEKNFTDEAGSAEKTDAVIPALGHDMKVVDKVIPVTGHPGVKAHYRCERDHEEYFDSFGDKKVTNDNRHELEYDMLTTAPNGWYSTVTDYSHTNDADPYVTITSENGLNAATSEYYTDLAFTARVQKSGGAKQFILLFFENKTIYSVCVEKGKITYNDSWCDWDYNSSGYTLIEDEWDGHTVSAGERDCYEGDGLEVTLARTGKTVKVLVNGQEVHSATLADAYEAEPAKGATIVHDAKPGVEYHFHVEPQAQAPAAPQIKIAPVDAEQGVVTLNQATYAYGDELVITVTPTANYLLDKLFVNGRDVASLVSQGRYTTTATNVVNVSAEFKVKEYGSVNAAVTGKKHGVTGNSIAENAAFELVGIGESYSGTLTDGKLVVDKAVTGEYTLKIEGYFDAKITVEKDTAYMTALALEYDLLCEENMTPWGLTTDVSHQNDGEAYIEVTSGGGHVNIFTNDRYNDIVFSATFKAGNSWRERKGIMLAFEDKKGVQIGFDSFDRENEVTLYFWGAMQSGDNAQVGANEKYIFESTDRLCANTRFDVCNPITGELYNKYKTTGLELSVVRDGNKILVLLDGKTVGAVTVDEEYADDTVVVGVFTEWAEPHQIPFELSETLPDFATPTFTLTQGENGTVTKTSGDTYSVWEPITLTIEPASDYRLKQLTVNGVVIMGNKTEYSFYPVAGANTVVAEFEQIPYADITFSADDKWNADGLVVTFQRNGETKTVTLGDNAVIENMAMDHWTATTVVGNMTVALGDVFIDAQNYTIDLAKMFNKADLANSRIVSANLATGEFVYNTAPNQETLWLNTVNIAQGSAFVSTKISLPAASKEFLKTSGKNQETFSIYLKVGNEEKSVTLWWNQDEGAFKFYSLDNWQGTDNLSAELKNAFIDGDGFYTVWAYNAGSGMYEVYAGLTPQTVTKLGEWSIGLPQNGTLAAIGFGDGFKWGGQSYQLNLQMNFGTTLNEALGITD